MKETFEAMQSIGDGLVKAKMIGVTNGEAFTRVVSEWVESIIIDECKQYDNLSLSVSTLNMSKENYGHFKTTVSTCGKDIRSISLASTKLERLLGVLTSKLDINRIDNELMKEECITVNKAKAMSNMSMVSEFAHTEGLLDIEESSRLLVLLAYCFTHRVYGDSVMTITRNITYRVRGYVSKEKSKKMIKFLEMENE